MNLRYSIAGAAMLVNLLLLNGVVCAGKLIFEENAAESRSKSCDRLIGLTAKYDFQDHLRGADKVTESKPLEYSYSL